MKDENPPVSGHYVYIYSDYEGRVRYVGYGKVAGRAASHTAGTHNPELETFLSKLKYRIQIAGPFPTEEMGRAVETSVISALKPTFNKTQGESRWRFRPLGVPESYSERQVDPELKRIEFFDCQCTDPRPVLFVKINNQNFADARVGYDPANPPNDGQIRERIDRWWQLGKHVENWSNNPNQGPRLLVGVFGSPGQQTVIGAAKIDETRWMNVERLRGGIRVPLVEPLDLDAFSLRGRRIDREAGIRFGPLRHESFRILDPKA
jgi:hypothetical protein